MVKALLDTNIVIDFLRGIRAARVELQRYDDCAISVMTWIEVLVGTPAEGIEPTKQALAAKFYVIGLAPDVAERAVELRHRHRIKLLDAIVWASAQVEQRLLVTRNTKDFPSNEPSVRFPYRV